MPMMIMQRTRLASMVAGLLVTLAAGVPFVIAHAQTPTPEQLQMFQGLTAEQQQMVLQQASAGGATAVPGSPNQAGGIPDASKARNAAENAARRSGEAGPGGEPAVPVLRAGDFVLIGVETRRAAAAEAGQLQKAQDLTALVRSRNPYSLDGAGRLVLPGFAGIALAGLTEQQASQRLSAEPDLLLLDVKLTRLPLEKSGLAALKRFGYDLFDEAPSTFSPVTDVPVPADYVVGPGDELNVQLFGSQNRNLRLLVSREGTVSLPELGPISVAGQTFGSAKASIESRVAQQIIGVHANVSMGDIRSIRIFVLGEAKRPGSYTVSGLATMTTALFASGGVRPIGSLRDIQLKRQGAVVRHLDLYDLLIQGNTSDDAKLLPGDVIFIPPVGATVSVQGEVKRPAIYELRGESDLGDALRIAGGLTPDADASRGSLQRVDEQSRRVVLDVNVSEQGGRTRKLHNGDVLTIERLRPQLDSGVVLEGFVHRPGPRAWREGMRISDLIASIDELKPSADQHYVLIRRESGLDRHVEVLSADLLAAVSAPGSAADVGLKPRDRVMVFDLAPGRERIIQPLLEELRLQSGLSRPTELVEVSGRIKVPGEYPLEPGMRISDLLRAGGNLDASAFGGQAELARYDVTVEGVRQTQVVPIDLAAVRRGDAAANLTLKPFDHLLIKGATDWEKQTQVTLEGEVRFPGVYPIRKGESLREVLERAGGLTPLAYPRGAVFTREEVRELEQKELERLTDRMQADLIALSLQGANAGQVNATAQGAASQTLVTGQALLAQMRQVKAVGRVVIDLPAVLAGKAGSPDDLLLRNGDRLIVPPYRQTVSVLGEVQSNTSLLYRKPLARDDYIDLSGGLTRKADKAKIYVVRADGSVVADKSSMFSRSYAVAIQPGDTIVVPLDSERIPKLPLWQSVTQILYNLTVSIAAVKSVF